MNLNQKKGTYYLDDHEYKISKGKIVFTFFDNTIITIDKKEIPNHPSIEKVIEYEKAIKSVWDRYCQEENVIISLSMNKVVKLLPRIY
jgi:hypothetical protein